MTSINPKRRLAVILLEKELVTPEQLDKCREIQRATGKSLLAVLVENKYLSEEDLAVTLSENIGIPCIRVKDLTIPQEVLGEVPEAVAHQYQVLPVAITGGVLTVAMADPSNSMVIDDISMVTSKKIEYVVALMSELKETISRCYPSDNTRTLCDGSGEKPNDMGSAIEENHEVDDAAQIKTDAEDDPVKKLVRLILFKGLEQGASDIHFEPFEKLIRIRYRVDGHFEEGPAPRKEFYPALLTRLKNLSGCNIDEHCLPQRGCFRMPYETRVIEVRAAFFPCIYGEQVVLRILDSGCLALDLDMLRIEPQPMSALHDALAMPQGLMLITGPPRSGKTTILYSALHKLNQAGAGIMTVEDPVEYEMFGISQTQVKETIGFTFAEALRHILFQDPDVVMVGEIQDGETAKLAVKAALTGHLVLSTLHADDAASVFPQLIDMGVEPFLVKSSVVLAASQRLLKRVCRHCKQPVDIPEDILNRSQYKAFDYIEKPAFFRAVGCQKCRETGYNGREAVIEAMLNWHELQPLVFQRRSSHEIKEAAVKCGMKTLRQNALAKAAKGLTTLEQVLNNTVPD